MANDRAAQRILLVQNPHHLLVHFRAFRTACDGIGDFPGLLQKLDYLPDLGVTCLWLLLFFSPVGAAERRWLRPFQTT